MNEAKKIVFGKPFNLEKELKGLEEDARVILEYFNQNNEDWLWVPDEKWPVGGCVIEAFRAASIITSINRIRNAFAIEE